MFIVWQEPERWNGYVLGVDTAEGLGHGDYSCIQVVDAKNGEQVAVWHGRIPPDELAHEVYKIGMWYGDALCCVESNNHGLTTITQLRQLGYPKLFRKRALNKSTDRVTQEFGWRTTRTSKPLLIDDLAKAMKNEELILHCEHTIAELRTYRRNEKGGMSGSPFDDRVMALALANQMRQYAYVPEYAPVVDDSWTFDWWRRQIPRNQEAIGEDVIGKNTMRGTV
jgi:hypothetical protein|tara:strand:- start:1696 stop:2367 length:672 start_codon:yes stop_codon:yes gene_type:complete